MTNIFNIFHIVAWSHPVQEAGMLVGHKIVCTGFKLLQTCFNVLKKKSQNETIQKKYSLTYIRKTVSKLFWKIKGHIFAGNGRRMVVF